MNSIQVSIVICTYNRAELLRQALVSLQDLRADVDFEIVVVDNQSTDDTQEVIAAVSERSGVAIRSFIESNRGISFARNRGIKEARGEWIASIDDDEVADPDWLMNLLTTALSKDVRCVGGRVELQLAQDRIAAMSPVCRVLLGESAGKSLQQRYSRRLTPGAGNLLIHRSVFDEIGLYDEDLHEGGEDTDLYRRMRRAGIEAWYTPDAVIRHYLPDYRLSDQYLFWCAERNGWHVAKREHRERGTLLFPVVLTARVGQLLVSFLPRYLLARALNRPDESLGARCLLTRSKGYIMCGLSLTVPRLFPESRHRGHLAFRSEREMFAT